MKDDSKKQLIKEKKREIKEQNYEFANKVLNRYKMCNLAFL